MIDHEVISISTAAAAKTFIKMNSDWLEYSDVPIKDYLDGYYGIGAGTTHSKSYLPIFVLLLTVIGKHIYL